MARLRGTGDGVGSGFRARGESPAAATSGGGATGYTFRSGAFAHVLNFVTMVAPLDLTVLLQGESGTGKSRLAQLIHSQSPRRAKDCARIDLGFGDDSLIDSKLFGHVRGSFTGAISAREGCFHATRGGTVFLDELGKASLSIQKRLLWVIEYREITPVGVDRPLRVDVRMVAATSVPLADLVARDLFLADLDHRIGALRIVLPTLRDHREDIPHLVAQMLTRFAPHYGYPDLRPPSVDQALMAVIAGAPLTGNIRELESIVTGLLVYARGERTVTLAHRTNYLEEMLPLGPTSVAVARAIPQAAARNTSVGRRPARPRKRRVSDLELEEALRANDGNKTTAAKQLDIDRTTVVRRTAGHPKHHDPGT
jgi:DNA-binding NtrC family response regulator